MTREEIFSHLLTFLVELFEVSPDEVTEDSRLYEDLDLDSIDAVDLMVKLQGLIGEKISPEAFKTVRTVGDVVDRIQDLVSERQA